MLRQRTRQALQGPPTHPLVAVAEQPRSLQSMVGSLGWQLILFSNNSGSSSNMSGAVSLSSLSWGPRILPAGCADALVSPWNQG